MEKFRNIIGKLKRIKKSAWVVIGLTVIIFSIGAVLRTEKNPSKTAGPNGNIAQAFAAESRQSPKTTKEKSKKRPNNLINEKSPYLLQHAYNPVDWYPWGEKAFRKARKENKPIFLSIGYATCHWCHVMEQESFSKPAVAAIMNKYFVSIKVDREERPDIDKIYMSAARQGGWGGGWPLSMWLTPDLKPFYGGTYFPPAPRWGRPGFPQVMQQLGEQWQKNSDELIRDANQIVRKLKASIKIQGRNGKLDSAWFGKGFTAYNRSFKPGKGGFSRRPKFPMPVNQNFLLRYYARTGEKKALEMVHVTLREMAKGGIYDHVGGGFHRYSTDSEWRVPHFEKMLYDNAQLTVNFLEAYQATKDKDLARIARETLNYVLRDMTHEEGGFYSAEDADSLPQELAAKGFPNEGHEHKAEGAFYLWEESEIIKILGKKQGEMFNFRYGVRPEGNAPEDPRGEFVNKNILYTDHTIKETAKQFGQSEKTVLSLLERAKDKLLAVRSKRPRSGLDDKVLTSWNGLMISALAKGSQVLEEPRYFAAAEKAARFIQANLYDSRSNRLYHRWREDDKAIEGMAVDYAFLVQGLLDLFEASSDPTWLNWAIDLTETQIRLFYDKGKGGFFMTSEKHDKHLLARVMVDSDNVEPSASSVAALNLLRLSQFTDREDFRQTAVETMERFGAQMNRAPRSFPQMLVAVDFALSKPQQIIIAGDSGAADTKKMLRQVHSRFIPNKILMVLERGKNQEVLSRRLPFLKTITPIKNKATAYVCINYACKLPTNDLKTLSLILDGKDPSGG